MSQFDRGVGTYWPTVCCDPRCTTTQTCQRERHERYGSTPGENYGSRCVPPPPPAPADDWAAVVAWLREQSGGLEGDALLEWMSARIKRNEEQRKGNE